MKKFIIIVLFVLYCSLPVMADMESRDGIELLETAIDAFYRQEKSAPEIELLFVEAKKFINNLNENQVRYYYLGQIEFYLALLATGREDKKEITDRLIQAQELVNQSLEYGETSTALSLLGETYMHLMNYKGFFYQMLHGSKLKALPARAIAVDEENYRAYLFQGIFFLNAPGFVGGSIDKGIENLQKALQSERNPDRFMAYVWLGEALSKKGLKDDALTFIDQALEIYPSNSFARQVYLQIINR